jgi:hypothetical protein
MFFADSRYLNMKPYSVVGTDGRNRLAIPIQAPRHPALLGYHRHAEGQRLDHIAAHYLSESTGFWRLCDVSGSILPDALAARALIGIPVKGR